MAGIANNPDIVLNASLDELIHDLDDKRLLYMTSGKIKEIKNNVLQRLYLSREELKHYHAVLKDYIFVDEMDEIKLGCYLRWFNLARFSEENPSLTLVRGGFVIDFRQGTDDIVIVCKSVMNRKFTLQLNKCIIFKKLSSQEQILVKILDYANK